MAVATPAVSSTQKGTKWRSDVPRPVTDCHDFYRSFRVQKLYGESPVLPSRPQPSATSVLPNPSEDRDFGQDSDDDGTVSSAAVLPYKNFVKCGGQATSSERPKFRDTHSWQSSASRSKERLQLAPDMPYRNTYGTADNNNNNNLARGAGTELAQRVRKPKINKLLLPAPKAATFCIPKRSVDEKKKTEVSWKLQSAEAEETPSEARSAHAQQHATNETGSGRSLAIAAKERASLRNRACYSVDFFRKPEVERTARPLARETAGLLADYAYRRTKSKRGGSGAMLDYVNEAEWPSMKRSQTAPMLIQTRDKCQRSADAYVQYLQQQRQRRQHGVNTPRTASDSKPPTSGGQKAFASNGHWRAPPVTPRGRESVMTSVRSVFTPTCSASNESGITYLPGLVCHREFVATKVTLTCSDTPPNISGTANCQSDQSFKSQRRRKYVAGISKYKTRSRPEQRAPGYITGGTTVKRDDKQYHSKPESLTVDITTVVDDVTDDM